MVNKIHVEKTLLPNMHCFNEKLYMNPIYYLLTVSLLLNP